MNALHRSTFAAALAGSLLAATPAAAQNLTRAQEGRAAVAGCYAACMDRAQTTVLALYGRADRLADLLISDEYHQLTEDSQNQVERLEEDAICALAQDHVRALDGCYAGCTDVERAYDTPSALAKGRFRHLYLAERNALQAVGLWDNYSNSATSGAAFEAACDRYWSAAQGSARAQPSRLAALPRRTGHRARPPVRLQAAPKTGKAE